jgi:hypothetical protein
MVFGISSQTLFARASKYIAKNPSRRSRPFVFSEIDGKEASGVVGAAAALAACVEAPQSTSHTLITRTTKTDRMVIRLIPRRRTVWRTAAAEDGNPIERRTDGER